LHSTTLFQHLHNITLLFSDVEDQTMMRPQSILRIVISHGTEALDTTVSCWGVRGALGAAMG